MTVLIIFKGQTARVKRIRWRIWKDFEKILRKKVNSIFGQCCNYALSTTQYLAYCVKLIYYFKINFNRKIHKNYMMIVILHCETKWLFFFTYFLMLSKMVIGFFWVLHTTAYHWKCTQIICRKTFIERFHELVTISLLSKLQP